MVAGPFKIEVTGVWNEIMSHLLLTLPLLLWNFSEMGKSFARCFSAPPLAAYE